MENSDTQVGNSVVHTSKIPWRSATTTALLLLILAGAGALIVKVRSLQLPTMTRVEFDAAQTLWSASQPTNYDIAVQVKGMQPGTYDVTVENRIAVAARFDGRDLKRQRTFGTWAVTGMFDTLARDLETNDKHNYLMLKAVFHPVYGFPTKYERIEVRTGAHDALQWEVTKFTPHN